MRLGEKSAYLQGLAQGLELDQTKAEGKLIGELLSLVSDMAGAIENLEKECTRLNDYIEELDADLGDVEEVLFEAEDDLDDDDEDCECDGCCGCDETVQRMLMCASCGETICYDETLDPETLICPACGKPVVGAEDAKDE